MASGTIRMNVSSIDWPNRTRGAVQVNVVFNWNCDDNGTLSFSYQGIERISGGNLWCVCATAGYTIDVDFSTNGSNWTNIMHSHAALWPNCDTCYAGKSNEVDSIARYLADRLGTKTLTESGYIRMRMWTPTAAPTAQYPNAFPDDAGSAATQVPVHIEVNWTARLKYDANGGSGAPGDQTASVPQATTSKSFTVSNTKPSWGDYIFLGWSRTKYDRSCTEEDVEYRGGDTFTIQKSNPTRTLYAVWMKDYRPGARKEGTVWKSHNRSDGKCHLRKSGSWVEMRTIDGGATTNNPPQRFYNGAWRNQYKIGQS